MFGMGTGVTPPPLPPENSVLLWTPRGLRPDGVRMCPLTTAYRMRIFRIKTRKVKPSTY